MKTRQKAVAATLLGAVLVSAELITTPSVASARPCDQCGPPPPAPPALTFTAQTADNGPVTTTSLSSQPTVLWGGAASTTGGLASEADEADLLEQTMPVPGDEDDYPRDPA